MTPTTWTIDPAHTDVLFSAKHMMVTSVRGKLPGVAGTVILDEENPLASSATFTIDVASIATGSEQRDGHLRSADFFDVEHFPAATFTATKVVAKGGADYVVSGDLTIRDITRPISFDVEFLGFYTSMTGARRAGFHATGKVNREDFGLNWNVALETGGWLVGKEIRLEIDLAVEEALAAGVDGKAAAVAA